MYMQSLHLARVALFTLPVLQPHYSVSAKLGYCSISMTPGQLIIVTLSISWQKATLWHTARYGSVIQFTMEEKYLILRI